MALSARGRRFVRRTTVATILVLGAGIGGAAGQTPAPMQPIPGGPVLAKGKIVVVARMFGARQLSSGDLMDIHKLQKLTIKGPGNTTLGPVSLQIGQLHTFNSVPPGAYTALATKYYLATCPELKFGVNPSQTVTLTYLVGKVQNVSTVPWTCQAKKSP
jgi:hypothetical protein